jgi:putative tryptophan/tyrosine transport system substrate-binding protein
MRRRQFLTLLGGAAAAWPLGARAQQPAMPVIGYLGSSSFERSAGRSLLNFKRGLAETGYVEDRKLLVNPADPVAAEKQAKELEAAVRTLGLHLPLVKASNAIEIEDAFSALVRDGVEALQIGVDPLFGNHTDQLVALATRHKVPTIYPWREFTAAGGLMNYGASIPDAYHQVGIYTGQILKGAKPSDLAVQRPTKLRFVLNLKAAKALGITFPLTLLARADEVIQ